MNKHLYKVIFNQERGQMMVVPENATAQGQSSTNTSAENPVAEPVDSSFVSGCLKPLTFSLMLMFGTAFIAETTEAANIQADKNAPKNEQPIVLQTPNGLPQVNIQTPSKAGVSVNQYRQFDVDEKGAILNNSRTNTQTQQAGWIQGNPLLATGEAKIIVNQVNSQNPSLLNGYVEVGGKRAEVILANPAGIQVNGGGFINAQSATLSTGQTLIRSGQLDQYAVHDGKISIKGKGLNAKDTDFTKIIGRYVEVDAPIAANDLTVIAGQNTVAADGKIQAAAKNTPKQKAVAIDTSELGGMYANKITLISTENNQSIDNKGQVFANAGGVTLDSQGNLSNAGTIASQGKTNIKAKDLDNSGTLSSKEQFDIKADNVDNSGTVLAANELNVRVSGSMKQTQSGNIEAARLDVETTKLDNAGTISQTGLQDLAIESTGALTNSGKIGYPEADNTVPTTANGGTTGTTAPTQNTPSSATGSGNATAVSSPSSIQNFATGSLKTRETLNNSGTINANGGVDLTAKNGLNNTAELQLNKLAVSGNVLDNSQAKISAQSTDIQTQSVNNAQGELLASKTLNISTGQLDNRAGKLQSVDNANLTVSGSLNNQKGEIAANNALNIQDKQAQNLHIDNTDGTIIANHVSLQSKSLNNQGKLAAGNHLSIDLKDDFTVERNLEAGNKLNIKTAGSLNNSQTIQAESEVNIQAKQNISNRGTMNSNGLTRVEAGQELLNIGTGKIYGNHVALAADSVVNRDENGKAAVVAARERLDIGARKIINQTEDETPVNSDGHSKLLSEDTLFIGRHLNENHHATGQADSLDNLSANIESAGDMSISAAQTTNKNLHIHTAIEKVGTEHKNTISFSNRRSGEHGPGDWGWDLKSKLPDEYERDQFRFNGIDNIYLKQDDGSEVNLGRIWIENNYTLDKYETLVKYTDPSVIQSGGNLSFDGNVSNINSSIIANKNIITKNGQLIQDSAQGTSYTIKNGTEIHRDWYHDGGLFGSGYTREDQTTTFNNEKSHEQTFALPTTLTLSKQTLQNRGTVAQTANAQITASNTSLPNHNEVALPSSSLYTINPSHPNWLVETDPAFTNYRQWLGSDYMLNALKIDPNHMHKRLGDGYYEQRMIGEQIAQLTGKPYFVGYQNKEEQYKALMNAGIQFAQQFNINIGTALSSEQMSSLTSPIVWLELQTVTLPNGEQEQVYVPKVYLANNQTKLQADGSLISAQNIVVNGQGNVLNKGTLHANHTLMISADNIQHQSGRIEGHKIYLDAKQDIVNQADIYAKDHLKAQAGRDIVMASATSSNSQQMQNGSTFTHSNIAQNAQIRIGDGIHQPQQTSLSLQAGRNITFQAASLDNQGNGTTLLQAGQNLSIGGVETVSDRKTVWDADNQQHQIKTTQNGSHIQTQGHIVLKANQKLDVSASTINSEHGSVQLVGQDVSITHAHEQEDYSDKFYSKNDGFLSSSSARSQSEYQRSTAVGSNITGKDVAIKAHNNLLVSGSQIISDDGTQLTAGGHVQITSAENTLSENSHAQIKKSGLMSTGSLGVTIGSKQTTDEQDNTSLTHTASTVGSLKGNTTIVAGKNYEQTGSIVRSVEGDTLIAAQKIDVKAAENRYTNDHIHTQKQSGVTVAVNAPVVQLAQSAMAIADNAKQVGQSKNDRVNAMAAANTAWQAYETGKSATEMMGQDGKPLDVSVSLTYGEQKNRHESHRTTTEAESSLVQSGGTSTLIATGAGKESDINITGSDVLGSKGTYLLAHDAINLTSAQQRSTENSSNKSSGWNAGISASYGQNGMAFGITAGGNYGKGHGNGESLTHRHTQVGDSNSATVLQSGGQTTIKGAQVHGKGIDLNTQDLLIESVQDTEKFNSKQQNISGQVTAGYGASFSGSYSQSKVNADHASVNQQSGLYAGDEGYRVQVAHHTDLKGALITSTAKAEADGKNQFSTNSLSHSDIENHSHYDAKGFGVGGSFGFNGKGEQEVGKIGDKPVRLAAQGSNTNGIANGEGLAGAKSSASTGYGSDKDSQSSVTQSGINTKNIQIHQDPSGELAKSVYTDITTETAAQHSGSLKNSFDKDKVQQEIDLQVKVSQDFNRNVQAANGEINKQLDKLKQQLDKGQISQTEYNRKISHWQQGSVLLNSIAAGLGAPTDSVAGIATATLAPAVSYQIGQEFKKSNEEGSLKHILAHAIVGAVVAQSGGNNALAGALSAGGAEALAPKVAEYLYGKKGSELNAEQKETVSSIMSLAGAATGAIIGNGATNAVQGSLNAENAVENNMMASLARQFANELNNCNPQTCDKKQIGNKYRLLAKQEKEQQIAICKQNANKCRELGKQHLADNQQIKDLYVHNKLGLDNQSEEVFREVWDNSYSDTQHQLEQHNIEAQYRQNGAGGALSAVVNDIGLGFGLKPIVRTGASTTQHATVSFNPKYQTKSLQDTDNLALDVNSVRNALISNGKIKASKVRDGFSVATASVSVNNQTHHFLSVSGNAWKGAPKDTHIRINNIDYKIVHDDNISIKSRVINTSLNGKSVTNDNHAEMKLAGYINKEFSRYSDVKVEMAVQNTSKQKPGMCNNGCRPSIKEWAEQDNPFNVIIYEGSTRKNP